MKTSYTPFADLIEAARAILADPSSETARKSITRALENIDECGKEREDYATQIKTARDKYASDDIEIDDYPLLSIGEDEVFVNAWVFVPHEDDEDDEYEADDA